MSSLRTNEVKLSGNLTDHNGEAIIDKIVTIFLGEKSVGSTETKSDGSYLFHANFSTEGTGLHLIKAVTYGSPTLSSGEGLNNLTLLATPSIIFDETAKCRNTEEITEKICKAARGFDTIYPEL